MNKKQPLNINSVLSLFHVVLGILLVIGIIAKVYSALIVVFGVMFIIRSKNENNEAALWGAYMVGAEVLFRMTGGMFFYELPKYSILLFLFTGLVVEKKRHNVSVSYLIYLLLLLIGIAFVDIPFNESIRKAIAFNLSGPFLLGLSAIYFYKRSIDFSFLLKILFFMGLPIISMLSYMYFKTPDLGAIQFVSDANAKASGGYGPNQVATILGMGIFIFMVHLIMKKRIFNLLFVDVLFFVYLIIRGMLTFSRGGMITALLAILVFMTYYLIAAKDKIKNFVKLIGLVSLFGVGILLYTTSITDGMIINRYTNKSSQGKDKKDFTTGRVKLLMSELNAFIENPFFGVGVGGAKFERKETLGIDLATHNEVSRLLGEHGLIGVFILILLFFIPSKHILNQPYLARAFLSAFLIFWFLTISHSAMRIAFPAFIYGLSVAVITFKTSNSETIKSKSLIS